MPPTLPPANRGSDAATLVAAMMLLVCIAAFFLLVMFVNPFIIGVLVLPLVFGPLAVFQYLIWGRWLARLQAEDREREAEQERQSPPSAGS